jgi:hypothetical protein
MKDILRETKDSTLGNIYGKFTFNNLRNGTYLLTAQSSQSSAHWGGGNPTDALLVNRFYIGGYNFNDNLKQEAADVNKDGKIYPTDALLINKRYVNSINSFKAGDWIFETKTITINGKDMFLNIKGICVGDVNATYIPQTK